MFISNMLISFRLHCYTCSKTKTDDKEGMEVYEPPHEKTNNLHRNEYPQSMFWITDKKNRYAPANPCFSIYKWGIRWYILHGHVTCILITHHNKPVNSIPEVVDMLLSIAV